MSFACALSPRVLFIIYQSQAESGSFNLQALSDFIFLSLQINCLVTFIIFLAHYGWFSLLKWKKQA